jgi:hypothetical protein
MVRRMERDGEEMVKYRLRASRGGALAVVHWT